MQGTLRQWFFHEDSWAITLGLGMVVACSGLFAWEPTGLLGQVHLYIPHWGSLGALEGIVQEQGTSFLGGFLVVLLITLASARGMGISLYEWARGFSFLFVLILICMVVGSYIPVKALKLEGPLLALLLGFAVGNVFRVPQWMRVAMRGEFWLKLGIILMGATLPFSVILSAGPVAIGQSLLISCLGFGSTYFIGKRIFGLDSKLSAALAGGLAVGNVTGVIACSEASKAKLPVIKTGFVLVVLSSIVLMFLLTGLSEVLALPASLAGAWIGSSETADVAGFAALSAMNSEVALQSYTLVKVIGRDMSVAGWAFLVAMVAVHAGSKEAKAQWAHESAILSQEGRGTPVQGALGQSEQVETEDELVQNKPSSQSLLNKVKIYGQQIWQRFPKFILGLFGASMLTAFIIYLLPASAVGSYQAEALGLLKDLRGWFFTLCFLSIGMSTRVHDIRSIGWRPVGAFSLSIGITTIVGYILSVYVFQDFWNAL